MSGTRPHLTSMMLSLASGAAMRMSAPRAICMPPPKQLPWMAAITGTGTSIQSVAARWASWRACPARA